MSRVEKNNKKLAILEVVKNKKDILFGSSQHNGVAKKEKAEAWGEVLMKAKSLGMALGNRKWTFARDKLFGLWKSRMLAKRENFKKAGISVLLDPVNQKILDIIGEDSPVIQGLNLPEADSDKSNARLSGPIPQASLLVVSSSSSKSSSRKRKSEVPSKLSSRKSKSQVPSKLASRKRESQAEDEEITALKKSLLKVEIYKTTLEAYKLERELGLPMSELTKEVIEDGEDDTDPRVKQELDVDEEN